MLVLDSSKFFVTQSESRGTNLIACIMPQLIVQHLRIQLVLIVELEAK